nr:hypothetical protein [Bordetella pertussis]
MIAEFSFSSTSLGVPERAATTNHDVTLRFGYPLSCSVGTEGSRGERCVEVCASSFSLPSLASGSHQQRRIEHERRAIATRSITAGMLP